MSQHQDETSVLEKIAATVRTRVALDKTLHSMAELQAAVQANQAASRDFVGLFNGTAFNVIAEIKFASPSRGQLAELDPVQVAADYLKNGATALSVLTEPLYFKGNIDYLRAIRQAFPEAYLLQKDFVVDPYQLFQGKLAGADAILIIVALLGEAGSRSILNLATQLGLTALVEVHNAEELAIAEGIGAKLIGINNRNLKDLSISLDVSLRLLPLASKAAKIICESGISSHSDLHRLQAAGCHGFLIGSSLMTTAHPGQALARLLAHAH